jgi:hypothetical protein
MRRDDVRFAAAARDDGLRKVSKYTWRAGAAGVVCSAVMAVAFGHHVAAQASSTTQQPAAGTGQSTPSGAQPTAGSTATPTPGSTATPTPGSTAKPTTGSTSKPASGGKPTSGSGGGGIVVPAQPPAPAKGSGQVTSGGT